MNLDEFYNYKERLMYDLLTEPEIVRLIDDTVDIEDAKSLLYDKVYPYEFIPETIEHGDTYVCCDVDIEKSLNKTYLLPTIHIWVFTHKSLLRLPEGGVRVDKLCSEIDKKINGSRYYGLGELEISSSRRFAPMTDYQGKHMVYSAKEFNRLYNPNKKVPANRRDGV